MFDAATAAGDSMIFYFQHCLIVETRTGKSKAGNDYGVVKFVALDYSQVFEIFCFAESLTEMYKCARGQYYKLWFSVQPQNGNAGARLLLVNVEPES